MKDSQAQRVAINTTLGGFVEFDKEYEHTILDKEGGHIKQLFPMFLTFVKKALKDLNEAESSKKWVPYRGPKSYCRTCGISHEAEKFFSSLLDEAVAEFFDSKEYMGFLRENGFAEEEYK
jgi:hypothetical protein